MCVLWATILSAPLSSAKVNQPTANQNLIKGEDLREEKVSVPWSV